MRRATLAALCASALVSGALPSIARAQANLAGGFQNLLLARYAAIARGDTAALRPQLADDLRWVIGANGAEVTKPSSLRPSPNPRCSRCALRSTACARSARAISPSWSTVGRIIVTSRSLVRGQPRRIRSNVATERGGKSTREKKERDA